MITKKTLSHVIIVLAAVMGFAALSAMANDNAYAAKKYPLPKEIDVKYYEDDSKATFEKIKYDKYGNLKSVFISEMIKMTYKNKYRNKKGVLSKVEYGDGEQVIEKFYDKKGRLTKVKSGSDTYKFTTNKNDYMETKTM